MCRIVDKTRVFVTCFSLWLLASCSAPLFAAEEDAGWVTGISSTGDGATLVVSYFHGKLSRTETATLRVEQTVTSGNGWICASACSPAGDVVATANWDGTVGLWSAKDLRPIRLLRGHSAPVLSVVFSSDGKHLFSSGRDQRILIWNIEKGTKEFELHEHRARVECLCLSPKGSLLASGDWDGTVKIWDLLKRQSIATIPAHKDAVLSIAFSPDGREMVTGAQDREPLKIWLVDGWKQKAVLRKDDYSARCVLFLSDDEFVVGTNLRTIQMWNLKSEKLVTFWRPHQSWVTRFAMLPDGKRFASGADDIKIWDINDARNKSPGKD